MKTSLRMQISESYLHNQDVVFVLSSQILAAAMSVFTKLLETGNVDSRIHPLQILLVRMTITTIGSSMYMWCREIDNFPLGPLGVQRLLILRATGGFFAATGFYYSLIYLHLAEAIVLAFLAPLLASCILAVLIEGSFTRREQIAAVMSITGVAFMVMPDFHFSFSEQSGWPMKTEQATHGKAPIENLNRQIFPGLWYAVLGICGGACSYISIRLMGTRVHPLLTVSYFSSWCMVCSIVTFMLWPEKLNLNISLSQGLFLVLNGIFGALMEFLLTLGLAAQKSCKAMTMIYVQVVFSVGLDAAIWGTRLDFWSVLASALIFTSSLAVSMQKDGSQPYAQMVQLVPDCDP